MEDKIKIFDTHTHYLDAAYSKDLKQVLHNAYTHNVNNVVLISAEKNETPIIPILCQQINESFGENNSIYPKALYTIGIHPDEIPSFSPKSQDGKQYIDELQSLTQNECFVGIGEVGLDYHGEHKTEVIKELQKEWFISFIELANKLQVPLVVHSRDAAEDTYTILEKFRMKNHNTVVHCYSYDKEMAKRFLKLNYFFGVGGVLTFKNAKKLKEALEIIPIDNIVLETDCPYLSPEPNRGQRNESANLVFVLDELYEIKKDIENISNKSDFSLILYNNALKLYGIYVDK